MGNEKTGDRIIEDMLNLAKQIANQNLREQIINCIKMNSNNESDCEIECNCYEIYNEVDPVIEKILELLDTIENENVRKNIYNCFINDAPEMFVDLSPSAAPRL